MKAALITLGVILAAVFVMILYACLAMAHECDELENYDLKEVESDGDGTERTQG